MKKRSSAKETKMALPTPEEILNGMEAAVTKITKKDFPVLAEFADRQMKALADQGVWIAEAMRMGEFDGKDQLRDHFLNTLSEMTENFAKVLTALVLITVEKLWNALVKVLWDAINKATSVALPLPIKAFV
jgi:hypothetical protein